MTFSAHARKSISNNSDEEEAFFLSYLEEDWYSADRAFQQKGRVVDPRLEKLCHSVKYSEQVWKRNW